MCAAPTESRQARHRSLPRFGDAALARLGNAKLLIIGVGGLGCAAAGALGAVTPAELTLVDFDRVDASNLARQTLFGDGDIGAYKADVAAEKLAAQNAALAVTSINQRLDADALAATVAAADVVLDCTDNFASRFAINAAAVGAARRLISGAAIRWEGQLATFGPDYAVSPCYACLYQPDDEGLDDCRGAGVLGPLPGVIGQMMAVEAIKAVTGTGQPARYTIYDAELGQWRELTIAKRVDCRVCGGS